MKKTLHLNLIRKWFNMIKLEIDPKLEEYRNITPYWCARFLLFLGEKKSQKWWSAQEVTNAALIEFVIFGLKFKQTEFIRHDTITFSNGMTPPVPRFEIEKKGIRIGEGKPEWGAVPGKKYFVFELGEIL